MGTRRIAAAALVSAAVVAAAASPAVAAGAVVTLSASRTSVEFGQDTILSGTVSSPVPPDGSSVEIVDPATNVVASGTTTGGSFSITYLPSANIEVRARFGSDLSPPVQLLVTPLLAADLDGVRLFGAATVSGRLDPSHPGSSVEITVFRGEGVVDRRSAQIDGSGEYSAEVEILRWGTYRARVRFDDDDHEPVERTSEGRRVRTPRPLHLGAKGPSVLALEARLDALQYHLPRPNQRFDVRTADAVLAFHKVQGMQRVRSVSRGTWKRLARPRIPKPRSRSSKTHVEIDQSRQVLYVVRDGEVDEIVHTSTGAGGATRDGVFSVHRKIAGFSPNHLYYPSYFDGNRAVHGWPEVPPYPASHGCSRVPYWTAKFLFGVMHFGMEVRVYH